MKKIRLVYSNKTKHSKRIAQAVAKKLKIKATNIRSNPPIKEADILFIIGGIYNNKDSAEMVTYINELNVRNVQAMALITSSPNGDLRQYDVRNILNQMNVKIIDEFLMRGGSRIFKIGHPNKKDIQTAINFAVNITTEKEKRKD